MMLDSINPIYSGKGISLDYPTADPRIHEIVQYLLGRDGSISRAMNLDLVKAVLVSENPKVLRSFQEELAGALQVCSTILPPQNESEEKLLEAFVGNVIALLPYCYPQEGDSVSIPMKVDGVWKMVSYTVDKKIKLAPAWFSKAISAYGLISSEGPPLLTFLGTTFPAGDGFMMTLLSDCTPGMSVGHAPYLFGKKNLEEWMDGKKGIELYGMSLGGSLAFQTLRHARAQIGRVFTYNPAGLYSWNWGNQSYDEGPLVHIYYQKNDLVAMVGQFPRGKNVNLYRVAGNRNENFFNAHARVYTGGEQVSIYKGDIDQEHGRWARKAVTALHFIMSFLTFPILFVCFLISLVVGRVFEAIQRRLSSNPWKEPSLG